MDYRGEPTKIDLPEENIFGYNTQGEAKALVRSRNEVVEAFVPYIPS